MNSRCYFLLHKGGVPYHPHCNCRLLWEFEKLFEKPLPENPIDRHFKMASEATKPRKEAVHTLECALDFGGATLRVALQEKSYTS